MILPFIAILAIGTLVVILWWLATEGAHQRELDRIDARRREQQERQGSPYATAVPSSSTIWPGIARRVTPSIVVVGATPAAPSFPASTP